MNTMSRLLPAVLVSSLALAWVPLNATAADSGEQIVGEVCSGCHGAGLMGAPKIGDTASWQTVYQKAGSLHALTETAEHGKGNMPPRGGESSLSDTEVQAAVQYMLGKSGVTF